MQTLLQPGDLGHIWRKIILHSSFEWKSYDLSSSDWIKGFFNFLWDM